jgi:hypothetical protein
LLIIFFLSILSQLLYYSRLKLEVTNIMFKTCLCFFQICGFYPVSIKRSKEHAFFHQHFFLILWSILHFLVLLSIMFFVAVHHEKMLYAVNLIGMINDVLVFSSLILAHLTIIVETIVKQKYFVKYWNLYDKVRRMEKRSKKKKWFKAIIIKLLIFLVFSISIEVIVFNCINSDLQWTTFWKASVFSLLMTRVRHCQHIFFIDIIFYSLQDINLRLKTSTSWTKVIEGDKKLINKFLYKNMKQIKEQVKNLMEMIICVNRVFCWSQVINFGQHFIEITSELYWVYAFATGPKFLWRNFKRF